MKKFIVALFACAEVFREPMSEDRARAYASILSSYSEEELVRACLILMRSSHRFPLPYQFIGVIEGECQDVEAEASAEFAYLSANNFSAAVVCEAEKRSDLIRVAVANCGGQYLLRDGDESFSFKRLAFIRAYKGAWQKQARQREYEALPPAGSEARAAIASVCARLPAMKSGEKGRQ